MPSHRGEFERIKRALEEADADGPLTAKEIREILADHGVDVESSHRVATVLGRWAERGEIDVIRDHPYRYRLSNEA